MCRWEAALVTLRRGRFLFWPLSRMSLRLAAIAVTVESAAGRVGGLQGSTRPARFLRLRSRTGILHDAQMFCPTNPPGQHVVFRTSSFSGSQGNKGLSNHT